MRGGQPWRTNRSRVLRSKETSAEAQMWAELRDRRLNGLKFVRQMPVGPYFTDFACRQKKIIVEVDGGTHSTTDEKAADQKRTAFLKQEGYHVYRVHNSEIYENIDGVMEALSAFVRDTGG